MNLSTLEPNYISWNHFKILVNSSRYITNFVNIANLYINLGHWPFHFKKLISNIIPKLKYDSLKMFHSIVFLNMLGKLIEKAIGKRLQIHSITLNFVYLK